MFHLFILLIVLTAAVSSSTFILGLIIYQKERNIFLRHFLTASFAFAFTLFFTLLNFYFRYFNLFPETLHWFPLISNGGVCWLISFGCWKMYPAVKKKSHLLIAGIFRISGFILYFILGISFFFFKDHFFLIRNIILTTLLLLLIYNFFLVMAEKKSVRFSKMKSFDWNLLPRGQAVANLLFYIPVFYILIQHPLSPIAENAGAGFLLFISFFIITQLVCLVFLVFYIIKPDFEIKPYSLEMQKLKRFGLSDREKDIVKMMLEGLSYKEIGVKFFISPLTVKTHAKNIYRKTGARNRQELVRIIHSNTAGE